MGESKAQFIKKMKMKCTRIIYSRYNIFKKNLSCGTIRNSQNFMNIKTTLYNVRMGIFLNHCLLTTEYGSRKINSEEKGFTFKLSCNDVKDFMSTCCWFANYWFTLFSLWVKV